jgi:hypothetical protein
VWHELREEIELELAQLHQLLNQFKPLIEDARIRHPNDVERIALAGILHSFYTGVENICKRIAIQIDGGSPRGEFWHRDLLQSMIHPGESRPAVITEEMYRRLKEYLDFRHVFRQAYSFELQWDKMKPLVLNCEQVLLDLETELNVFLQSGEQNKQEGQN